VSLKYSAGIQLPSCTRLTLRIEYFDLRRRARFHCSKHKSANNSPQTFHKARRLWSFKTSSIVLNRYLRKNQTLKMFEIRRFHDRKYNSGHTATFNCRYIAGHIYSYSGGSHILVDTAIEPRKQVQKRAISCTPNF
jgi:hypothetical protein